MKRPQWLTTGRVMTVTVLAVLIAVGYALSTGRLKSGIGADQTQTISEKTDKQGNILEKTKTTTFQDQKTLWDWLSLLGVPFSLTLLGLWFQSKQQERNEEQKAIEQQRTQEQRDIEQQRAKEQADLEREIAAENRREEALQTYFDRISTLLVEKNLLAIAAKVKKTSETEPGQQNTSEQKEPLEQKELLGVSVDIIRARTLSILRRLKHDPERKTSLIQFLLEAEVISKLGLSLSGADLSDAILGGAILSRADLSRAILSRADLSEADLSNAILGGAILSGAILSGADLGGAILSFTNLSRAILSGTDLSRAILIRADLGGAILIRADLGGAILSFINLRGALLLRTDLREARELKKEQLEGEKAPFLCNVALPEGFDDIDGNRDCEKLPQVLLDRYPEWFKTLEEAKVYVDWGRKEKWD